ncbi:xylulokinase [Pseudactinotalea sp. HY160]|uniref:FGGY family carbohydrate kinase n=1 Tax=Pseudactinotalea sp. HY160 TaxID=2654490 RepID=UPI00128E1D0B|nr:FGGY family carbohydrate kinase [Pseudactinotalea sp. HY160]MPV50747.1 xylulokinase [Pseudactinotalea sp. HY160]
MTAAVMGVDSSTQSCTVELRALESGVLLATASAHHPATSPPVSEQHPDAWWAALLLAGAEARSRAESEHGPVHILGVAVGAQCHGLTITGSQDRVIRPAKLWNDTTSGGQAARLVERYGARWWANEMGIVPSAAITVTKLAWLFENEPDSFAEIRRLFVPHDWLTFRLTGNHVTDRSDASGTGYYAAATNTWRTDMLAELFGPRDWEAMLPTVLGPDETAGRVTPEAARALGLDASALVGPGGGDQHLAAQGIGLVGGDVAYSLGTSGVVFATTAEPVHDPSGAIDGVANTTGGYLPLVCTLNAAKVTDAAARLLGVGHAELSDLALAAPITPDRPVLAAYLDGERSPRLPAARGMMAGLTSGITREQFALAAYEGVVLGLARGERQIASFGVPTSGRALVIGGGARSAAYRQIVADLTGHDVHTVDAAEATARGAAVQASAILHGRTVAEQTRAWQPRTVSVTRPQADRSDVFDRYVQLADLQADGTTY